MVYQLMSPKKFESCILNKFLFWIKVSVQYFLQSFIVYVAKHIPLVRLAKEPMRRNTVALGQVRELKHNRV